MPLDVQPLSLARHFIMIVVMLALLAASLGFAQLLVQRRQSSKGVRVDFPPPPGVVRLPVNSSAEEVLNNRFNIAQANWPGGPRQFVAFCFPDTSGANPWAYLSTLFVHLVNVDRQQPLQSSIAVFGGHGALQVTTESQAGGMPTFAIMRLASMDGYIVAFCFSGEGLFTDDDWRFFDDYCTHQVRIQVGSPTAKSK